MRVCGKERQRERMCHVFVIDEREREREREREEKVEEKVEEREEKITKEEKRR